MTPSDQLASVHTNAAPRHSHVVEGFIASNSASVATTLTTIDVELSEMSKYPTGSATLTLCSHADAPAQASVQRFAANFGGVLVASTSRIKMPFVPTLPSENFDLTVFVSLFCSLSMSY